MQNVLGQEWEDRIQYQVKGKWEKFFDLGVSLHANIHLTTSLFKEKKTKILYTVNENLDQFVLNFLYTSIF